MKENNGLEGLDKKQKVFIMVCNKLTGQVVSYYLNLLMKKPVLRVI